MENGFKAPTQRSHGIYCLPLAPLTVAVNTTVTTHCDSQSRGRSNSVRVLVIGEEEFPSKDGLEGSSTFTIEERKLDDAV